MHKFAKQSTVLFVVVSLLVLNWGPAALAQERYIRAERTGEKMIADLVLLRPAGFIGTVLGSAVFVVSLPFSAIGGNSKEALEKLVKEPARYTFSRPLGDF